MTRAAKGEILVNNLIGGKVLDNTDRTDGSIIFFDEGNDQYEHKPSSLVSVIIVAKSGGDFTSVKDACDFVITQTPTAMTPFTIIVSGAFVESPFSLPSYTKLYIQSGSIMASDMNNSLITMDNPYCEIIGGNIIGGSNADAILITAGNTALTQIVVANSGNYGVHILNTGGDRALLRNITVSNGTSGIFIENSFCIITTSSCAGATDSGIEIDGLSTVIIDSFVGVGNLFDLKILDSSLVRMNASQMDESKISIADWTNVYLTYNSTTEGDEGLNVSQEFHVGSPEKGYESSLGEGDSYTRGMLVYSETELNVFTNRSVNARSASASSFTYDGVVTDNAIYIASSLVGTDVLEHYGIKTKVLMAAVKGAGDIIIEYWNGSSWVKVIQCL